MFKQMSLGDVETYAETSKCPSPHAIHPITMFIFQSPRYAFMKMLVFIFKFAILRVPLHHQINHSIAHRKLHRENFHRMTIGQSVHAFIIKACLNQIAVILITGIIIFVKPVTHR